jgi:hypothetical protein
MIGVLPDGSIPNANETVLWARDNFLLAPLLPHKCGFPPGYGTPHLCGSEELWRAPPFFFDGINPFAFGSACGRSPRPLRKTKRPI